MFVTGSDSSLEAILDQMAFDFNKGKDISGRLVDFENIPSVFFVKSTFFHQNERALFVQFDRFGSKISHSNH